MDEKVKIVIGFAIGLIVGIVLGLSQSNSRAPKKTTQTVKKTPKESTGRTEIPRLNYGPADKVKVKNTRDENSLSREILLESLQAGRTFLLNNQKREGNFTYEYDFVKKAYNEGDNQVRQAGAFWGLALIHQYKYSKQTEKALLKSLLFFETCTIKRSDGAKFIAYPGMDTGSTGTVALASLALIDILRSKSGEDEKIRNRCKPLLDSYIRFLRSLRTKEGLFYSTYSIADGKPGRPPSPYFDGETLLCMVKASKYLGYNLKDIVLQSADQMYLNYVTKALAEHPDSNKTKGFFQWGTMSFYEILTSGWGGVDKYSRRIIDLSKWMIDVHRTLSRTRNTSYAYEGIVYAHEAARLAKDTDSQKKFAYTIDKGLYKLSTWQVGSNIANSYLRKHDTNDPLAVGGILNHRKEPGLRIDVTQHQMHAVILALKYVYKK